MAICVAATLGLLAARAAHAEATVTAGVPSLVTKTAAADQYVFFPQTLHWVKSKSGGTPPQLLLSYQACADALHDGGWTGATYGSGDNGSSWYPVSVPPTPTATHPDLVKPCVDLGDGGALCFQYPLLRPASGWGDNTTAVLPGHVYKPTGAGGTLEVASDVNATVTFPRTAALKAWGPHTYMMVTDGTVMPLRDGSLLMLVYGDYVNASSGISGYSIAALHTGDQGQTWQWRSTVTHGAPSPCNAPSEHDCARLASGDIYCVWRSTGGPLCSTSSSDEGMTWGPSAPLRPNSPPPAPPTPPTPPPPTPHVPTQCQAAMDAWCSNATLNAECVGATERWYGASALPMRGLFGPPCSGLECPSPSNHNCTCTQGGGQWAWRCYSVLALDPSGSRWSNASRHPNAYCSECGPALEKIFRDCTGKPWVPPPSPPPLPKTPFGVEPKLVRLPNGKLVLSTGRPGLFVWVADDPPTAGWTAFNVAEHHNAAYPDASLHYTSDVPGSKETTAYTGMVGVTGTNDVIVSYDRLANGWSPAPWPKEASAIFAVRLTVS